VKRAAFSCIVLLCCLTVAPAAFAQAKKPVAKTSAAKKATATPAVSPTPAPPSPEVLKARMRRPVKGTAYIEIIQAKPKLVQGDLVSVVQVKNVSDAPIIGLKIDQYFYHQTEEVSAGTTRLRNPLAPGEITEMTVSSPNKPGITGSQMMFSHANGQVKPTAVKKFTAEKK
jgi:hypothetical protein